MMTQSVPLHYGIYYFRLSCEYYSDAERENFMSINKGRFLSLAENLLKNGHIEEAFFYYYHLNGIALLKGKHQDFFNFASLSRDTKSNISNLKSYYEQYSQELEVPYGILMTENAKLSEAKDFLKNLIIDSIPEVFGKTILKIKFDRYNQQEDLSESIQFLEHIADKSGNQSLFKQLIQKQNFICAQITRYHLLDINQELEKKLATLKKKIQKKYKDENELLLELFQVLFSKQEVADITQISSKAIEAQRMLIYPDIDNPDFSQIISDGLLKDFYEFKDEQGLLFKVNYTAAVGSNNVKILENLINEISTENYDLVVENIDKKIQNEIQEIESIIEQGKNILQLVFSIDEHNYKALHQWFKLTIYETRLYQYLKFIQFLQTPDLRVEYQVTKKYLDTKVFISYSSKDRKEMESLKQKLEEKGVRVYVDENSLNETDYIEQQLKEIIANCSYLVTLISPNSLSSEWVGLEILSVIHDDKKMKDKFIPLIIDDSIRTDKFRDEKKKEIDEKWEDLHKQRNEEEKRSRTSSDDLSRKLKRFENLNKNFPIIYSEITEKVSSDFYNFDCIEKNFPKLLKRFTEN